MKLENNIKTLYDIFMTSIKEFSERPVFSISGGDTITYDQFGSKVNSLATILAGNGIKKGDKVAVLGASMPNWPISYFATISITALVVPILPDFTAFEIANVIKHSGAKALVVSSRLGYKVSKNLRERLQLVINMDKLDIISSKSQVETSSVEIERPTSEDLATIIYTSGTSGASKGVMLTHSNLVAQVEMSKWLFPINRYDTFLSILPLSHAYECSIGMLYPVSQGSCVVYLNGAPTPSLLMPALSQVKPTIMLSVPLIVDKIYKLKIRPLFTKNIFLRALYSIRFIRRVLHRIAGKKLLETFGGNLRFFGVGGSKLDGAVEQFLLDAGFPYAIGYGLTETSPLLSGAAPGNVKWQSTGQALKGVQMKIINPNSKNIGEIVVKGPNIMKGYYKDPKNTEKAFTPDGWFRTNDLGYIDKDGFLFMKGRKDNMIVSGNGENIYPEEIESVINDFDLVMESLVIEKKGKLIAKVHFNYDEIKNGDYLISDSAALSYKEKLDKIKRELLEFVNDRVNKSSKIAQIEDQLAPFEKTATQKIKRFLYH
ncbi:MAG: AMP-binding protein [Bacteroidales bacterium]|nr:AMP-binding protein [Bacteroidales bacterium]MDD4656468.1 AMP-binding protein [Bacteroidales bacterium]